MKLIIGNKNYSSWSLRAWLALKHYVIEFEEVLLPLYEAEFYEQVEHYSASLKVPALQSEHVHVWDSLAILETINELYLNDGGWPKEARARAHARAISCEMHSGFFSLREMLPMTCKGIKNIEITPDTQRDIDRVIAIWTHARMKHASKGDWLFGDFCLADAMFAPVALRFYAYQVALPAIASQYVETVLAHPSVRQWMAAGKAESWVLEHEEKGVFIR